jgi:hypothetical protein
MTLCKMTQVGFVLLRKTENDPILSHPRRGGLILNFMGNVLPGTVRVRAVVIRIPSQDLTINTTKILWARRDA